jgi:hypothetical protein
MKFDAAAPAPNYASDWSKPPTRPMLAALRSGRQAHSAHDALGAYSRTGPGTRSCTIPPSTRGRKSPPKPALRDAWKRGQRPLAVIDDFVEWKKLNEKAKEEQPYAALMGRPCPTNG